MGTLLPVALLCLHSIEKQKFPRYGWFLEGKLKGKIEGSNKRRKKQKATDLFYIAISRRFSSQMDSDRISAFTINHQRRLETTKVKTIVELKTASHQPRCVPKTTI